MRSTNADTDLTSRARVRDAAIQLFGEAGFHAVSIRQIAEHAGVSPALVIHHFGNKEALRDACDDHVVTFVATKADDPMADLLEHITDYGRYIARLVTSDGSAGNALFDRLLDHARSTVAEGMQEGRIRDSDDAESLARVLVIQALAPLVLHAQLARVAGESSLSQETLLAIARPTAEIYTRGLFLDDALVEAVAEAGR